MLKLYYSNWSGSQHIPQIIKNTEQIIQKLIIKYPSRKTKQKKMVQEMGLTCRDWVFRVDSSRVCCGVGKAVDIDEAIMDENLVVVIPILLFLKLKLVLLERMWKNLKGFNVDTFWAFNLMSRYIALNYRRRCAVTSPGVMLVRFRVKIEFYWNNLGKKSGFGNDMEKRKWH